jgi:hypothetical protein
MATAVRNINNQILQPYSEAINTQGLYQDTVRRARKKRQQQTALLTRGQGGGNLPIDASLATAAQMSQIEVGKKKKLQKIATKDKEGRKSFFDFANTTIGRLDKRTRSFASYLRNVSRDDTVESYAAKQKDMRSNSRTSKRRKKRAKTILNMYKNYLQQRDAARKSEIQLI